MEGRHHLLGEQVQGAERLYQREIAPREAADDVVDAGRLDQAGDLVAHARRRPGQNRLVAPWSAQSLTKLDAQRGWTARAIASASVSVSAMTICRLIPMRGTPT